MYTRLCAGLFFPLHERLKGHSTVTLRKQLEESQWWSPERLNRLRVQRLRAFLQQIGSTVPYYQRLFAQERFDPNGIESLDALARLPFLTKPLIRAQSESLKAIDAGALTRYNTGGSSGEPLIFYIGKGRRSHDVAAKWRATRWWNADIGDREVVVWGSPIELGTQDRLRRLRDGLMRSHLLPAFELSEANLDRFAQTIRRLRPRMLFGYPSSLALIARHARGKGLAMNELGIRVAFVTSERLYDDQRQIIGSVFGCPMGIRAR
jgi:phenylacetate-CoA ligase